MNSAPELLTILKNEKNPINIAGMARFGINPHQTMGVTVARLRELAKSNRKNHEVALELYQSGIHEAKILAALICDPAKVTVELMNDWVPAFDSWDVCDQVCLHGFSKSPDRWQVPFVWMQDDREFVRRAGFVMIAVLAVKDTKAPDSFFIKSFPYCEQYATDARNFVKKAISWALRQTGRKRPHLLPEIKTLATLLIQSDSSSARWIGRDVILYLDKLNL